MTQAMVEQVEGVAQPVLGARGLVRGFGGRRVLDGVALQVAPGSVVGLAGRNGAGKTTLIECLLGLQRPDQGEAWLLGRPSQRLGDAEKARLGYVAQRPDSFGWMRVGAMLDFVAGLYPRWDHGLAAQLLQRWGLHRDRWLRELSPGQRQQVAIVRALAPRPDLLVLDEPAAALDPVARRALLREIVDGVLEHGSTVLFSSHILSDLERVASHVAVLHGGRLLLHESLDALKDGVRRAWLPAGAPLPPQPLPGELARRRLDDGGWSLLLRGEPARLREALPAAAQLHALGLEDLFVELAG
ncbi:ABC transporter ATP-binding protein [Pseudorhodoferax sp.]|uniref:ABC transporter ATP-binding protein n=1 Tax=Pseudorhodoferax sp. TaxID=1993553 RepID=UPI0039E724D2